MADIGKRGPKNNSRRKGVLAREKDRKRSEAEVRQAAYDKLPLAKKLEGAGTREKAKLLAKSQK